MPTVAFTPNTAGTVTLAPSAASATATLVKGGVDQQIFVQATAASAIAYIEFGSSSVAAAAATGTPILPGQRYTFTVGPNVTTVAAIGSAGSLYFTSGQGENPN